MSQTVKFVFDISQYSPTVQELLKTPRIPALGPGKSNSTVAACLRNLTLQSLFDTQRIQQSDMAKCCLSALWLWHDFLDESHSISQNIESSTGSYWHGIMHRREPDYFNAKYWFNRVRQHAIFPALGAVAAQMASALTLPAEAKFLVSGNWNPATFVDLCEIIARGKRESESLAQQIAILEWQMLFHYCWENALSS